MTGGDCAMAGVAGSCAIMATILTLLGIVYVVSNR